MKTINGTFKIMLLIGVLIVVLNILITHSIVDEIDESTSKVGKSVVVKDDTLIIVNYSIIFQEYELNNGQKISFDYFKTHQVE